MNNQFKRLRAAKGAYTTCTLLAGLLMLNACSTAPEGGGEAPKIEDTSQVTPSASTDAVPSDENPELALAVAAGAVIVDGNTPAAATDSAKPIDLIDTQIAAATPTGEGAAATPSTQTTEASAPVVQNTPEASQTTDSTPAAVTENQNASTTTSASGDGENYQVKSGDTLMKIAFEQYGDLYRWRDIYSANKAAIQDPNHVPPGTMLKLETFGGGRKPGSVSIDHNGDQYLIKLGDTLGTISDDVYGTKAKWKALWENNRQLIKDPNKIYAGFFLYYIPETKTAKN